MSKSHSIEETEEFGTTVYRCTECGLVYQNEETFDMFRCSVS